jgi:hypothetical protein
MSSKKKLVLVTSAEMDDRSEGGNIRMSAKARKFMGFNDEEVEIWTKTSTALLKIHQAFKKDVEKAKALVSNGQLKKSDLNRIGFVTTNMYESITANDQAISVWISGNTDKVVIGADPEFLLFDEEGRIIAANSVMTKPGLVGSDGAMAEVRPPPSKDPDGLVSNIRNIFADKELTVRINPYKWIASCYYRGATRDYPTGGHIHIGNPKQVARMPMSTREMFFNVFNKIIDEKLSIACIRLDGPMGKSRRTNCQMSAAGTNGWGWFGEWRPCDGRLEHRTLSGMWLIHPVVAKCVLGTAKAIIDEVIKLWASKAFNYRYVIPSKYDSLSKDSMNDNSFTEWAKLPMCKDMRAGMTSGDLRSILNNSESSDITKSWLNNWHKDMKELSTYKEYYKYIDGLGEILRLSSKELLGFDRNIKNNWLGNKQYIINI